MGTMLDLGEKSITGLHSKGVDTHTETIAIQVQ